MNQYPGVEAREALWKTAKQNFADPSSDDVELDDASMYIVDQPPTSRFSVAEGGCWVLAWVFVRDEEA